MDNSLKTNKNSQQRNIRIVIIFYHIMIMYGVMKSMTQSIDGLFLVTAHHTVNILIEANK